MNKPSIYKIGYSGFSATFVGNGIGRFAYIALLPALVQANWFSQKDASYLGVATLVGYLVGSLVLSLLTRYLSERTILRLSMLLSGISYVACALPPSAITLVLYLAAFCWCNWCVINDCRSEQCFAQLCHKCT